MMPNLDDVLQALQQLTPEERHRVFRVLREEIPIHPLEGALGADAEVILEAIDRIRRADPASVTIRGIRGLMAEAAFASEVIPALNGWRDITPPGNHAFDFSLTDGRNPVRVQVKLQRSTRGQPTRGTDVFKRARLFSPEKYAVETWRTRTGQRAGENTRFYPFGVFDILAVGMHPSSGSWSSFMFTVERWLLPQDDPNLMLHYQPVAPEPNDDWTDDFETCVRWLRSDVEKRIRG